MPDSDETGYSAESLPVHLGDTEIVDGVIVHDGRDVGSWAQAVVYTGAAVVAVGTVVVGAAVVIARRKGRADELRGIISRP
jgi:hypothetical protein